MIYVIVIDAFLPWETEAHTKIISRGNYLCNCNCNLARKEFATQFFIYVMFLWTTVINSETIMDVNSYIPFSIINSPMIDVM